MKIFKSAGVVLALALMAASTSGTAVAQDRTYKEALEECFWGLLFPDEDQRGISLGLNVVSGSLGTYAYSSATMTPDTFCADKKAASAKLINESYPKLAEDIVRGEGKYLATMMQIGGCDTAAAQTAVANDLRNDLANVLTQPNYSTLGQRDKAYQMFQTFELSAAGNCTV